MWSRRARVAEAGDADKLHMDAESHARLAAVIGDILLNEFPVCPPLCLVSPFVAPGRQRYDAAEDYQEHAPHDRPTDRRAKTSGER